MNLAVAFRMFSLLGVWLVGQSPALPHYRPSKFHEAVVTLQEGKHLERLPSEIELEFQKSTDHGWIKTSTFEELADTETGLLSVIGFLDRRTRQSPAQAPLLRKAAVTLFDSLAVLEPPRDLKPPYKGRIKYFVAIARIGHMTHLARVERIIQSVEPTDRARHQAHHAYVVLDSLATAAESKLEKNNEQLSRADSDSIDQLHRQFMAKARALSGHQ